MIGLVKGTVDSIRSSFVIIDAGGVGYKVLLPVPLLSKIKVDEPIKVYTYTYVREDTLDLFGFETYDDLSLFELFLTVSGIGPKTAIGIFSVAPSSQIRSAVISQDLSFFAGVPRLGKKNAQKIIIELSSKMGDFDGLMDFSSQNEEKEITTALKDFGFKSAEIAEALKKVRGEGATIEEKMKLALKHLAK